MRILDLALKDLSQVLRDRKSLLFLVVMPIAFTLFMGIAFAGAARSPDRRLPIGWASADDGPVTAALHDRLAASTNVRIVETEAKQAESQVAAGDLSAAVIVPAGYSAAVLAGDPVQLRVVADSATTLGQSALQFVQREAGQVLSAAEIARLSTAALRDAGKLGDANARAAELEAAFTAAASAWANAAEKPLLTVQKGPAPSVPLGGNPYNQASPGVIVQFVVFGLVTSAEILVIERKTRTLQRMLTTNLRKWEILAGHALAMFTLVAAQMVLLIVLGQLAFDVNYAAAPLGVLLVSIALGLWVSALGVLIGVLARSDEQAVLFSLIAMFLFTALGGAWFPLETAGATFRTLGHLSPAAWAMDGYQNILVRGLGSASALLPAAILLGWALVFFALGWWRFSRQSEA